MSSTNVGSIHYQLGLDTSKFDTAMATVGAKTKSLGNSMTSLGKNLTAKVTLPLGILGGALLKNAADFEQTRIGLENMLGSADKAKKLLSDISKFAAETPFEFPELAQATRQLVAFGFSADEAFNTMKNLGDVSAAVGTPINDLAYLMGTLKTQGRAFTIDIRQFAQRGIPIYEYLAKVLGTNEKKITEMIEAGKIGFPEVQKAFQAMTKEGGKFNGAMAAQSKSLKGLLSTVMDNVTMLGRRMLGINEQGDVIDGSPFDRLRKAVESAIKQLEKLGNWFTKLDPKWQNLILAAIGLSVAIGPVLVVLGMLVSSIGTLIPLLANPVFLVIAGVLALIAGAAYLVWKNWSTIKPVVMGVVKDFQKFWETIRPIREFMVNQFKSAWRDLKASFNDTMRALAPYKPELIYLAKLLGGVLLVATMAPIVGLTLLITALARLFGWFAKISSWITLKLAPAFKLLTPIIDVLKLGISGLGGIFSTTTSSSDRLKAAQDRQKQAHAQVKTAIDQLKASTDNLNNANLSLEGASLGVERAQLNYNEAVKQYGPKSLEAREAAHGLKSAQQQQKDASDQAKDASTKHKEELKKFKDSVNNAKNAQANLRGETKRSGDEFTRQKDKPRTFRQGIISAFSGMGNILRGIGSVMIGGLWSGMLSQWRSVQGWVKGIAGWIKNNKGPIEKDKKLLVGAGNAIMQGFNKGLNQGYRDVMGTIVGISSSIKPELSVGQLGQGVASSSTRIYGNINIGSKQDADYFFKRTDRNQVLTNMGLAGAKT